MHVIIAEELYDPAFVEAYTAGFGELSAHVLPFTPAWGADETGLEAHQIISFARAYASTRPAMIVLGGSSMHKGANGWHGTRAISCLPALTGDFGLPGGGLGPRHGAQSAGLRDLSAPERRPPGSYIPNQMPDITEALSNGRLKVLLLLGTNMLSSFADAGHVAAVDFRPFSRGECTADTLSLRVVASLVATQKHGFKRRARKGL